MCEEHKKQINITVAAGTEEEKLEALDKLLQNRIAIKFSKCERKAA